MSLGMKPEQGADPISTDSVALHTACGSDDLSRQEAAYRTLWHYLYRVALQVVYDQPDAEALAEDCAQETLIRVHNRLAECREPHAFRAWTRRIAGNIAIDNLRRRRGQLPLSAERSDGPAQPLTSSMSSGFETGIMQQLELDELRDLLNQAPVSDRSRRVVIGRYLDNLPDEELAEKERKLVNQMVRPSHIQVTRSKNISKLRRWERLLALLRQET